MAFRVLGVLLIAFSSLIAVLGAGETHWSLAPLDRPPAPTSGASPIDGFISQRLAEHGLSLSPAAAAPHWIRRTTFDLTGLPPSLQEMESYLQDDSSSADERLVDRLLASPRYGERWARHWMDVVRYAETHGHDEDAIRENAWPYRDWIIRALNADKPYADFVREQVAGDVLQTDDPWAAAGIGFLGCGPWDQSSQMGIQDGTIDKKIAQYLDRDDMLSATMLSFTSTTVHCARCHDHKFDPVSLQDYYALQAVFAGVDKAERPFETDPAAAETRARLEDDLRQLDQGCYLEQRKLDSEEQAAFARWEAAQREGAQPWRPLGALQARSLEGTPHDSLEDGSILFRGTSPERDTYILTGTLAESTRLTGLRLDVLTDPSLPQRGPGRADNGNFHLTNVRLHAEEREIPIKEVIADFNQTGWEIDKAVDSDADSGWGIHPQEGRPHRAIFLFAQPVTLKAGDHLQMTLEQNHGRGHVIGRLSLSLTDDPAPDLGSALPPDIVSILTLPTASRTEVQQRTLQTHFLFKLKSRQLAALPPPQTIFAVASYFPPNGNFKPAIQPREVHVLNRGNVLTPLEPAQPGALSCIPGMPGRFSLESPQSDDEGARRLALANWLVDDRNVLTWRSMANRLWHYHFGRGIVDTPNDFGKMGGSPSHPELLDWLALELRDGGGSLKRLHKMILLSATYRQRADDRADAMAADPDNRLLWRMPRRRLQAECVRDAVLHLSGLLDLQMGGPSARQFHTRPGVHITPVVDYETFDPDHPANFRRGVYRFVFRTVPDPLMQALDCPDASQLAAKRESASTPLQALAMLNNRFMVRQSEHIAARLQREVPGLDAQVTALFQRAYGRPPGTDELRRVTAYAHTHGLANACRVLINSSEFLFLQ